MTIEKTEAGDLVVVQVKEIRPNSVLVDILDTGEEGMVHISEVARTWIKDIRKYVKDKELTVAQVLPQRANSNFIDVSLKRVNENQKKNRLREWQQQKKVEKFVNKLSSLLEEDTGSIQQNVIEPLEERYETPFKGFEMALVEPEDVKELLGKKYFDAIASVAQENIRVKEYTLEETITLAFTDANGLKHIQQALSLPDIPDTVSAKITYLASPTYKVTVTGKDVKDCKKAMQTIIEHIQSYADQHKGEFAIEEENK